MAFLKSLRFWRITACLLFAACIFCALLIWDCKKSVDHAWDSYGKERDEHTKCILNQDSVSEKEYIVKRKKDCYELFHSERDEYNNTKDFEYVPDLDVCRVYYSTDKYEGEDCTKYTPTEDTSERLREIILRTAEECITGMFYKEY